MSSSTSIGSYFYLLGLRVVLECGNLIEYIRVVSRYYSNKQFRSVDLALLFSYLLRSPFAISKEFLRQRGQKNLHEYGETPLTVLDEIVQRYGITEKDTVYELGCGRGRSCFWLHSFIKCRVVGIDYLPEFIEKAQSIQSKFQLQQVEFRCENMFKADLRDATAIYLYGTTLSDESIFRLLENLQKLKPGTKVISVTFPLTEFSVGLFELVDSFPVRYPWGVTDVFLQKKLPAGEIFQDMKDRKRQDE